MRAVRPVLENPYDPEGAGGEQGAQEQRASRRAGGAGDTGAGFIGRRGEYARRTCGAGKSKARGEKENREKRGRQKASGGFWKRAFQKERISGETGRIFQGRRL